MTATNRPHLQPPIDAAAAHSYRSAVFLLCLVSLFNVMDRKIVGILGEAIKSDLQLSDSQMGLLTGFAFSVAYSVSAIPIARLADRGNRARILAVALGFWSVATVVCGLVGSFWKLLAARMAVAVGESACTPASYALIADYYPKHRAKAMSTVTVATAIGTLLSFSLGGLLVDALSWRAAFVIVGAPGLILALVLWRYLPDPRALSEVEAESAPAADGDALRTTIALLRNPPLLLLLIGSSALVFALMAQLIWTASYFQRVHHWSLADTGIALGVLFGASGIMAPLLSAFGADRLLERDAGAYPRVMAILALLSIPFMAFGVTSANPIVGLCGIGIAYTMSSGWPPLIIAAIRTLAGAAHMALAIALLGVAINFLGGGLGPLAVGALSEYLTPKIGAEAIRYALLLCCSLAYAAAGLAFWRAAALMRAAR